MAVANIYSPDYAMIKHSMVGLLYKLFSSDAISKNGY